jgi:hypothetical protein
MVSSSYENILEVLRSFELNELIINDGSYDGRKPAYRESKTMLGIPTSLLNTFTKHVAVEPLWTSS